MKKQAGFNPPMAGFRRSNDAGFTFLELMVAVVVLVLGVLITLGMFARASLTLKKNTELSKANLLAQKIMERTIYQTSEEIKNNSVTVNPAGGNFLSFSEERYKDYKYKVELGTPADSVLSDFSTVKITILTPLGSEVDLVGLKKRPTGIVVSVAKTQFNNFIIKDDGSIWSWGRNALGELGRGSYNNIPLEVSLVPGLKDAKTIVSGLYHTIFLKKDGSVWMWGGGLGGPGIPYTSPKQVPNLDGNVKAIASGWYINIALKDDGTVWEWQGNTGAGTPASAQKVAINDVKTIACGTHHALAVKNDGTVLGWGQGVFEDLQQSTYPPVQISGLSNVKAVSAGITSNLVLKDDGTVYAWGSNEWGQLGNGTFVNASLPTQVIGLNNIVAIDSGRYHNIALKSDGTIWVWGANNYGQLGNGTYTTINTPIQVPGLNNIKSINAGYLHSLILKSDGTIWTWGDNMWGELGDGNPAFIAATGASFTRNTPAKVFP